MALGDRIGGWLNSNWGAWGERFKGFAKALIAFSFPILNKSTQQQQAERLAAASSQFEGALQTLNEMREGFFNAPVEGSILNTLSNSIGYVVSAFAVAQSIAQGRLDGLAAASRKRDPNVQLPPGVLQEFLQRRPDTEGYIDDSLARLGYSGTDRAIIKELTQVIPSIQDLLVMLAKEAFEPDQIAAQGLGAEFPSEFAEWAGKHGLSLDWAQKFWYAHWTPPSIGQGYEMLHRGVIDDATLDVLFRVVEVAPFWREKLKAIAYNPITRVDIRRMWQMGVANDSDVVKAYLDQGYMAENANKLLLFTKLERTLPELRKRFTNGWISTEQLYNELQAIGLDPERANRVAQTIIKAEKPERTKAERELTKTDIINGVKKGVISNGEGETLLQELGYDASEARFILAINAPVEKQPTALAARTLTKTEILTGLRQGILSVDDAFSRLLSIRYTEQDAEFLLSLFIAELEGPKPPTEREITKAEITKAYKAGLIDDVEATRMLITQGFTPEQTEFILRLTPPAEGRSPTAFEEFRAQTQAWREAQGLEAKVPSQQIQDLDRQMRLLRVSLENKRKGGLSLDDEAALLAEIGDVEVRLRRLLQDQNGP